MLAKLIRKDKRIWGVEGILRSPESWIEAHKVVLEHEASESTNKAAAQSVMTTGGGDGVTTGGESAVEAMVKKMTDQIAALERKLDHNRGGKDKPAAAPAAASGGAPPTGKKFGVCFNARDFGSCKNEKSGCRYDHDKEALQKARAEKKLADAGGKGTEIAATGGGDPKGGGKGKKGGGKG